MPDFKKTVLIVAVVVLLCLMILISVLLRRSKSEQTYIDGCPDYWTTARISPTGCAQSEYGCCPDLTNKVDDIGSNCAPPCSASTYGCCSDRITAKADSSGSNCSSKCYNVHTLGKTSSSCPSVPTEMDFTGDTYTGPSGICNKRKWAKQCGLTWDGITDVNMNCP